MANTSQTESLAFELGRKYGVLSESERIIKLLEENKWRDEVVFDFVIALIKGDNK